MGELNFRPIALFPFISALGIFSTIIYYLWKAKHSPQLFSLLVLQFIMFVWPLGQAIQYCAANDRIIVISIFLIHTSIAFIGLAWLIFTLYFTGAGANFNLKKIAPFGILPLLTYIIFLTNHYHHLYFKTVRYDPKIIIYAVYGSYYWFGAFTTYGFVIAGMVILARYIAGQTGINKKQAIVLFLAPLLSFLVSFCGSVYFFFVTQVSVLELIDPTPTLFAVFVFFFSIAVFKYRFLNINQGAFIKTFENLHDSILVVDHYHCITNFNDSFAHSFGCYNSNEKIKTFVNRLKDIMLKNKESEEILAAIEDGIEKPVEIGKLILTEPFKTYEVIIQRLDHRKQIYRGRIITFHDVTEYNRLLEELNQKNEELFANNQKLNEHLQTVEELAVANERNRVSREIHDTLGHSLTLLIMLLKAAKIEIERNPTAVKEKLTEGIKIAQTELNELRTSISGLLSKDIIDMNIFENIKRLGQYMENLGIHIEFSIIGKEIYTKMPSSVYKFRLSDVIYRISKEAITNSLRHGNATEINIIVKFSPRKVNLFIIDNGRGCWKVVKGFGLTGMEERVGEMSGRIKFGSDGESGFNIQVELPMEDATIILR